MGLSVLVQRVKLPLLAILLIVSAISLRGQVLDPCTPALTDQENVFPVRNNTIAYCVSDYGWSDTMFSAPIPDFYDPSGDLLSGDNAYNLRYSISGVVVSGNGWLTPGMDAGHFSPSYQTGSPWVVIDPLHYTDGTRVAQSRIHQPDHGLDLTITTEVNANTMTQTFQLVNNGMSTIEAIRGTDYFNFHPNGTASPAIYQANIAFSPDGGLVTTGPRDSTFVADGRVYAVSAAAAHDLGFADPSDVINRVENNLFNGLNRFGPDDAAGALAWDLGALRPGETLTWSITMELLFPV